MTGASEITSQQTSSELPVCQVKVTGQQRSGTQIHNAAVPYAQDSGYVIPDSQIISDKKGALGGAVRAGGHLGHPAARVAAPPLKKMAELTTDAAVPKGRWVMPVIMRKRESNKTSGVVSHASRCSSGFLVIMMPWGPIMMLIGLLIGGVLGFGLAMANDMCRLRKKSCAATQQKRSLRINQHHKLSQTVVSSAGPSPPRRHIENSQVAAPAPLCIPVSITSFTPRAIWTELLDERTERCLFYADNSQGVQTYVMKGGDLLQRETRRRAAILKVEGLLRPAPAQWMFADHEVFFCSQSSAYRVEATCDILARTKPLHKDRPALRMTFSSEEDSFRDAVSEFDAGSSASYKANPNEEHNQDSLPGDLRPVENFNVALTYNASVERVAPWTLEGSYSSAAVTTTEQLSIPACNTGKQQPLRSCIALNGPKGMSTAVVRQQVEGMEVTATCDEEPAPKVHWQHITEPKPEAEPARLFESYEDLINFDTTLKHQTPIGAYEFQFLDEREEHDPHDPSWELTVNQQLIKVYKYISPNSPVVIVKAYASFDGIPLSVLSYNIKDINSRLEWDTTFGDYRIIEKDVNGCEMIYCMMKAPFPVSNRDFLQWRRTIEDYDEGVVKMILRSKNDPNSSTLFLVAQTDVKGLIPKWLVNTTAARAPVGWVENLRRACKKHMEKRCIP
ncbi:hypothetical protein Emag_003983 [Eimeria magna]